MGAFYILLALFLNFVAFWNENLIIVPVCAGNRMNLIRKEPAN
jgi:hypothetical protein